MSGLDNMKKRINFDGGCTSDNRNVRGKYLSFKAALENSYQAEWITIKAKDKKNNIIYDMNTGLPQRRRYRCLINPDKLTMDYDQKEISIAFDSRLDVGDDFVLERVRTYYDENGLPYQEREQTHWLVYLRYIEEEAYFRGRIRMCHHMINGWWCYVRGPVETAIIWRQKHQLEMNDSNLSILLYVAQNEETNAFFKRFQVVKFDGHNWRVAATDRYSQPGIIEVYLEEYFDNDLEDAAAVPEIIEQDPKQPHIEGPQFVKPYDTNIAFSIVGMSSGVFTASSSKVKINKTSDTSCLIEIMTGKSTKFILTFTDDNGNKVDREITVQSL